MPKRISKPTKRSADVNQLAAMVVHEATVEPGDPEDPTAVDWAARAD